jgi:hypothetical protein
MTGTITTKTAIAKSQAPNFKQNQNDKTQTTNHLAWGRVRLLFDSLLFVVSPFVWNLMLGAWNFRIRNNSSFIPGSA